MKSIFQKAVYEKLYKVKIERHGMLGISYNTHYTHYIDYETIHYPISHSYGEPAIYSGLKFIEYIDILETYEFKNIFSKGDKICIEDNIYIITDVIYGLDKTIYRLKEYEIIDNEESKEKAMEEYKEKMNEYNKMVKLKQKERQKEEELLQIEVDMEDKKLNKKWRQFWK